MRERLAFALDYPTVAEAEVGAARVAAVVGVLKVGLELFVAEGPAAARLGRKLGVEVFLDLKLHDIPETVERAVATALDYTRYEKVVEAVGGKGYWVDRIEQLGPALDAAFAADVPSCVNVKIAKSDFRRDAISV